MNTRQRTLVVAAVLSLLACSSVQAQERGGLFARFVSRPRPVASAPAAATTSNSASTSTVITTTTKTVVSVRQEPQQPALAPAPRAVRPEPAAPTASKDLSSSVFGSGAVATSQLSQNRRDRASTASTEIVSGRESSFRASSDAGSLLGKSNQSRGVATQKRTPIITDTRVRGAGVGSLVASGG